MNAYLRLTITDSLLADGNHAFNPLARVTRTFWYRLPRHWIKAGRLLPYRRDQIINRLYSSECCEQGGGSNRCVILELSEQVLSDEEASRRPWLGDRAAFFVWREGDVLEEVIPAKL